MYLGQVVEHGPVDAIFHAPSTRTRRRCCARSRGFTRASRTELPADRGLGAASVPAAGRLPVPPALPEAIRGVCERHEPELSARGDRRTRP